MANLVMEIAGVEFKTPLINASGPKDESFLELETLGKSQSAAIMMKSCTVNPRTGNVEPRFWTNGETAIQCMGLPNLGYKAYGEFIAELRKFNKPIIASVSGESPEENAMMVKLFQEAGADLIEVNLSCPNIPGRPQVAYDLEQTEANLKAITGLGSVPIGLKLPPFYSQVHIKEYAEVLLKSEIRFISTINSIGNTLVIDPETERSVVKPNNGLGGLSGPFIKPVALSNVRMFYQAFRGEIQIFGVGGVSSGTDVLEFMLAGADAVQAGIVFWNEGPDCFARINKEFDELLDRKGYMAARDLVGKLRDY
ncbi:dihydroorotate oxidase [Candidatus Gracilibacteria bacterium]|nr:dihydroorotate oxidase [Candidatus Gracilibacteria bacterium]